MIQLKFSANSTGKLFADTFGDIRLADYEKFIPGNIIEIWLGKECLGKALVIGYKEFSFKRITDTLAQMNCGKGAAYQATLIKKFYGSMEDDSLLMHIVFKWHVRNMEVQEPLIRDWWQTKREQFPNSPILFN